MILLLVVLVEYLSLCWWEIMVPVISQTGVEGPGMVTLTTDYLHLLFQKLSFHKKHSFKPFLTNAKPRTLTEAEKADKLAEGLCYFCDQPYKRGHKCNHKKTQFFFIEIPSEKDE